MFGQPFFKAPPPVLAPEMVERAAKEQEAIRANRAPDDKNKTVEAVDAMEAAHQAETAALVAERHKTHGDWRDNATCAQDLKAVIRARLAVREAQGQAPLSPTQLESLEMICHKIGRIVAGDASFADHWDDIAGYAKIANR